MKNKKLLSPKGTAIWPKLNRPDTRFDPLGVYSVTLRLPKDDAADFLDKIEGMFSDHYNATLALEKKKTLKKCDLPFKAVEDDTGDETGEVDIKFKLKARVEPKNGAAFDQRPNLFDAKLNPISRAITIGAGSSIKVSAEVYPWYTPALGVGISLRCRGVQVINLVEPGGDGEMHGFEKEDGFEAGDPVVAAAETATTETEEEGDF